MIDFVINENSSIKAGLKELDEAQGQPLVVVDGLGVLVGTVTDGDIRRYLLKGGAVSDNIRLTVNIDPCVFHKDDVQSEASVKLYKAVPVIDSDRRLVAVRRCSATAGVRDAGMCAVIMAGGLGTRLRPLTLNTPKPLVELDGKPLIVRLVEHLKSQNIDRIFVSVNYLKEKVIEKLGDGSTFGLSISYIHEDKPLGTAGALGQLEQASDYERFVVMNGDIFTNFDLNRFIEFHHAMKSELTVATVPYEVSVPFGVIEERGGIIASVLEKPTYSYPCNAGIYLMERSCFTFFPKNDKFDMPTLVNSIVNSGKTAASYSISEYWADIGTIDQLKDNELLLTKLREV